VIVVPAIDLLSGNAVRLEQGRYDRVTVYDAVPEERARAFAAQGAARVHVVDLEGARDGAPRQRDLVARIVQAVEVPVQVGGGVRTLQDARVLVEVGARWVVMGTSAVRDPEVVRRVCAALPDRVIIAIDARDGRVAVDGWTQTSDVVAEDLARQVGELGAAGILYTDIARDGMRRGPNIDATTRVVTAAGVPVLASGGVGSLDDLRALAQARPSVQGAIVGRALYAGAFSLTEALAAIRAAEEGGC